MLNKLSNKLRDLLCKLELHYWSNDWLIDYSYNGKTYKRKCLREDCPHEQTRDAYLVNYRMVYSEWQ